jgi:broad specificity phosphatase PhoE
MLDEVLTSWQGHPHSELAHITFNYYDNPLHPNDEDLDTVWHRVRRFITIARKRHTGQTIVAVSHGDPVMLARAAYLGLPLKVSSLREPNVYAGKGSILRLVFPLDAAESQPTEMAYYDPNSTGAPWSSSWVTLKPGHPLVHIA